MTTPPSLSDSPRRQRPKRTMLLPLAALFALSNRTHAARKGLCDDPVNSALPFCDGAKDIDTRVADLVARIPLTSVVGLLVNNASALNEKSPPVRLDAYEWWNEALHGVGASPGVHFQSSTPHATSFPQVLSVAASFNRTLFYEIGQAISTEARAFYNAGNSGLTFWAPNINIYRDPRWGRGQETPGEDPVLNAEYAVAFVRGLQGDAMDGSQSNRAHKFLKISATCKHFSSYSQEVPRHRNDAIVTKQDQADTYFPMFEACVKQGRASGVMCSYNAVNGIPSCADRELLTGLVRDQWKFDGYIMTDCEAIHDVIYEHHYTQSPARTCATVLNAGVDLNCGEFFQQHLVKAIAEGVVDKEQVRTALKRLFRMQMRLGMFEKSPQPFSDITSKEIDTPKHRQLALEAARQSIVLLKNDDNLLPLNATAFSSKQPLSLALVGPHFNASDVFLGNYAGIPTTISTPLNAITSIATNVSYAFGCNVSASKHDLPDFGEAEKVAKTADQVVVFVGLDQTQEREEIDRSTLYLPGYQPELIDRVIKAAPKPIVLVVIAGGCVDRSSYRYHPKIGAIVYAGYPGQAGGQAIADVVFGNYNPSGRLTQTFYAEDFVKTTSIYDMHMRPFEPTGNPGRTHRFYQGSPVFKFGEGLSFTTFHATFIPSKTSCAKATGTWSSQVRVNVTNTGAVPGEHVVLLFAEPPPAPQTRTHSKLSTLDGRPLQKLVAFGRTGSLAPSASETVTFSLSSDAFSLADEQGRVGLAQGSWVLRVDSQRIQQTIGTTDAACVKGYGGQQQDQAEQ